MSENNVDFESSTGLPTAGELVVDLQCRLEAERRAIERELHDEVSGMLAAARMDVSVLRTRAGPAEELREHFTRLDGALERAIRATRQIMQRLRPALLDHFGLPVALKHLVEESCRAARIDFSVELPDEIEGVERDLQIAAFRVVQELLTEMSPLVAFRVRLDESPATYELQIDETLGFASGDAQDKLRLAALRVWIVSLGGQWRAQLDPVKRSTTLVLPRKRNPA